MPSISVPPSIIQAPPLAPGAQRQWTRDRGRAGKAVVTASSPAKPEAQVRIRSVPPG